MLRKDSGSQGTRRPGKRPGPEPRSASAALETSERESENGAKVLPKSRFSAYGQRTVGGMLDRMLSTLPPVFSPKIVPRS